MEEVLGMSTKERDRLVILRQVAENKLTQIEAAEILKMSDRNIRYLLNRLKTEGDRGVVSKRRGKTGNHKLSTATKIRTLELMRGKFEGFGPTFAAEKLKLEVNPIKISKEGLRKWMMEAGIWQPKQQRRNIHRLRNRRSCFGELIQGDGSHHDWFNNGQLVNCMVFVDDATSTLTALHFSETETLEAYFAALEQHLTRYGRPRALYVDHSAVAEVRQGGSVTQFHKATEKLDIQLILANSAPAKGRVERTNRTLQDRLCKELKLRNIKTIEEANAYAPEFIKEYSEKFSKEPASSVDAHRPLEGHDLSIILRRHVKRTLLADCTFQYNNHFFEVKGLAITRNHTGRKVDLYIAKDGSFRVFLEGIEHDVVPGVRRGRPLKPETKNRKEVTSLQLNKKVSRERHWWRRWDHTKGPNPTAIKEDEVPREEKKLHLDLEHLRERLKGVASLRA
jgi:hypothetical protein